MSSSQLPDHVRDAFDAAVDARRRFHDSYRLFGGEKARARRQAVNDLHAANLVLAAHSPDLVEQAGRVASQREGGAA